MEIRDLLIIGGGVAGLSAGIYAARGKADVLLVEKGSPGSQAATTDSIENYPGFPDGVDGPGLIEKMKRQAMRFGLRILTDTVKSVDLRDRVFVAELNDRCIAARSVIVATGANPRKLGVKGENTLAGVSYCATCDGALFEGAKVAVVGGGDAAVEEALYLTRFASKVYIIHRRDTLRAAAVISKRALENGRIEIVWNTVVKEIEGKEVVDGLVVQNVATGMISKIAVEGLFIYVGTVPNSEVVKRLVNVNDQGYIITDEDMRTSIPGIFAAGDVRRKSLRQVVTAASDGAVAAVSAEKYLMALTPG